jgi:hypothetical protein
VELELELGSKSERRPVTAPPERIPFPRDLIRSPTAPAGSERGRGADTTGPAAAMTARETIADLANMMLKIVGERKKGRMKR